jgi:hypothetical protein
MQIAGSVIHTAIDGDAEQIRMIHLPANLLAVVLDNENGVGVD